MLKKVTIICGPEMLEPQAESIREFDEVEEGVTVFNIKFPEKEHGAASVALHVGKTIQFLNSQPAPSKLYIHTRYEHSLSKVAELVADGWLDHEIVTIYLFDSLESYAYSTHGITEAGFMTNAWIYGILS